MQIFTIFFSIFCVFGEGILYGKELSDEIYKYFESNGFSNAISKETIATTGSDIFAYNIIIDFLSLEDLSQSNDRNTLIVDFKQSDILENKEKILLVLNELEKSLGKQKYNVRFLFAATDNSKLSNYKLYGTEVFASEINDNDKTFALVVDFNSDKQFSLFTGAKNSATPLWLSRQVSDSFARTNINFEIEHPLLSLYRLGIIESEKRMNMFIKSNIPAAEISLDKNDEKTYDFLKNFIQFFDTKNTSEWDVHYLFVKLPFTLRTIWINERILIISSIIVTSLSLLLLCGLSFIGKNGARYKRDFMRSWYMIPLTIFFTIITMLIGQKIIFSIKFFQNINPIYQFTTKLVISMILAAISFAIQEFFRFPITAFVYGYIISIVAIVNIFIFSAIDILFFVVFGIEYLIIYISRTARKIPWLIFWTFVMMIPFFPYLSEVFTKADKNIIERIVFCSLSENIMIAFAIFPFHIMWQKFLVGLNIFSSSLGLSTIKLILNNVLSILIVLVAIFLGSLFFVKFIYKENIPKTENIIYQDEESLSVKITDNDFLGMKTNHIKIDSSKSAIRYEVILTSSDQTRVPLYESTYDYTTLSKDCVSFTIPDFPPQTMTIDYAADSDLEAILNVKAFFSVEDEESTFRTEERIVKIGSK